MWISMIMFGCDDDRQSACGKGKYLGQYCDGAVIQILGEHNPGRDWDSIFEDKHYENCFLASIDSTLTNQHFPRVFISNDSVFYFRFVDGGYARKQYSLCLPDPFVTITFVSNQSCSFIRD
jgi:hypothetical protein